MNVLLASMEFETLTGQPMYNYNLAKGLVELGHNVTCVGLRTGGTIKEWLNKLGVKVYDYNLKDDWFDVYDLVCISECIPGVIDNVICDNIYNFCHSKGEADTPIERDEIKGYLFPRKQVQDHWGKEGTILPIPIDFEKFKKYERDESPDYIIVAPCTIDSLRKPMLLNLLERAKDNVKVWIIGKDHGALDGVEIPENVTIFPESDNIVEYMKKADELAGIFIGTVTLEAWAVGLKTSVYDELGRYEYVNKYDIKNNDYRAVAKEFIKLSRDTAT